MDKLKIIIKITVSLALMWLAISRVDFDALWKIISKANITLIIISFLVLCFGMTIMVWRWKVLLDIFHKQVGFWEATSIYWIGLFFNLFLPSAVGGDAVKMYKLSKRHGKPIESSTTVLLDRAIGLSSLTILATINLLLFGWKYDFRVAGFMVFGLVLSLSAFFILVFNVKIVKRIKFVMRLFKILKIEKIVRDLYISFNLYRNHLDIIFKSLCISFTVNVIVSFYLFLLARSIGIDIAIFYFFIIMPLVFIIMMIPISISGLGLQDGAYVFFLGQLGVSATHAFSLSILAHFTRYLVGLLGGFAYMLERDRIK